MQYLFDEMEESIYNEEKVENYIDNDMISSAEAGFMMGYLEA